MWSRTTTRVLMSNNCKGADAVVGNVSAHTRRWLGIHNSPCFSSSSSSSGSGSGSGTSKSSAQTSFMRASSKVLQRLPSFVNVSRPSASGMRTAEDAVNNILYNMPPATTKKKRHVLAVFVDNEAGVLSRVSGLLAARGFNIDSLSVSKTDVSDLSRMTIVLNGPDSQLEQARRQLGDLVDVWAVFDYQHPESTFERELLIVKVNCKPPAATPPVNEPAQGMARTGSTTGEAEYEDLISVHFHRQAILDITKTFGGKVSDIGSEHMIIEIVSWPKRVDAFLGMLKPFGIVEAARSGVIAMGRSPVFGLDEDEEEEETSGIDAAALPPS